MMQSALGVGIVALEAAHNLGSMPFLIRRRHHRRFASLSANAGLPLPAVTLLTGLATPSSASLWVA
jgi:hypothetical protein